MYLWVTILGRNVYLWSLNINFAKMRVGLNTVSIFIIYCDWYVFFFILLFYHNIENNILNLTYKARSNEFFFFRSTMRTACTPCMVYGVSARGGERMYSRWALRRCAAAAFSPSQVGVYNRTAPRCIHLIATAPRWGAVPAMPIGRLTCMPRIHFTDAPA